MASARNSSERNGKTSLPANNSELVSSVGSWICPMKNSICLLLGLLAVPVAWLYVNRILEPWEQYVEVEHGVLLGLLGDLYPRWVGTREFLLHGRNPYGREVSDEIQIGFYGHPVVQDYSDSKKILDEQRFAYPIYVVFFTAPVVFLSFAQAQLWVSVALAALTAISVVVWMDILRWKPPRTLGAAIVLFVLTSPQVVQGLRLRQLGLLVGFLIAIAVWCIVKNRFFLAGVALALSTIKPQMTVLVLGWFVLWGTGSWPRRRRFLAGFGGALATLVIAGQIMLPGWIKYFAEGMIAYRRYVGATSLIRVAAGNLTGITVSILTVLGLAVLGWKKRAVEPQSPEFQRVLSAFLVASSLILPLVSPFNQVLLLMPALILIRDWKLHPAIVRRFFTIATPAPWLAYLALIIFRPRVESPIRVALLPSALIIFVPFFLAFGLEIMRREAIAPLREIAAQNQRPAIAD
jgi:hypothetical protein